MKICLVMLFFIGSCGLSCRAKADGLDAAPRENSNPPPAPREAAAPATGAVAGATPREPKGWAGRFGVVEFGEGVVCLKTARSDWPAGTPVTILTDFFAARRRAVTARIERKRAGQCADEPSSDYRDFSEPSYYALKINGEEDLVSFKSFAVIAPKGPAVARGRHIAIDADGDGRPEYFRQCTGNESLHLTVWTGKSLKSRRLWHGYYHLLYDTVPTCETKEWDEPEQEN